MPDKIFSIVSEVFSVPLEDINDNSGPESIESWDSFNGLILVDKLELEFSIKFTLEEIVDVKNISDIKRHLKNHGVNV